jgi:hypothetical protein
MHLFHFAVIRWFMCQAEQYFKTSWPVKHFFHSEMIDYLSIAPHEPFLVVASDYANVDEV